MTQENTLQIEIDSKIKEISTDSYAMSLGELMNLYLDNELDISPDFQRFFRWSQEQKSKLIESLFLGIPIPPIFVSQREDGVWDVVDGVQRLSTIFEFAGILKKSEEDSYPPSVLSGTKYLPSLNDKKWNSERDDPYNSLTASQRMFLKRAKINLQIILKQSDISTKYELFMRLNTLGSKLSDQEIRNCFLTMTNPHLYKWIEELSKNENFINATALSDRNIEEAFDKELVLRFLIFRNSPFNEVKKSDDLSVLLTEEMEAIALENTKIDLDEEKEIFEGTFALLNRVLGSDAFHKFDPTKDKFVRGFLVSGFEAIAIGISLNPELFSLNEDELIVKKIKEIWTHDRFKEATIPGTRATSRVMKLKEFGQDFFNFNFNND